MTPCYRTLTTTTLCFILGVFAGKWDSTPVRVQAPARRAEPIPSGTPLAALPPPFTSTTASMEWVRAQMQSGDTSAAERFFRQGTDLTDEQRLGLARELVQNARRMDPHVLARIILGLPRGQASDTLLWRLVSDWSTNDAESTLLFIETLPPDRLNSVGVLTNSAFGLSRLVCSPWLPNWMTTAGLTSRKASLASPIRRAPGATPPPFWPNSTAQRRRMPSPPPTCSA
jgi:hypothetical protein